MKKRIQIKRQCLKTFKSFEYIDALVKCSNGHTRLVTIYRPPPSRLNGLNNKTFFDEFATLAEQLVAVPGNLLIVGDFNYHLDASSDTDAKRFNNILESFNLHQHVNLSTHKHGHTLDLVITRSDDDFVTGVEIKDPLLSDHSAVHCKLRLKNPPLEQVEVEYRKLPSIGGFQMPSLFTFCLISINSASSFKQRVHILIDHSTVSTHRNFERDISNNFGEMSV